MTERKRLYRLPDDSLTEDSDQYGQAWRDMGFAVEAHFPGYEATAYDPFIRMTRRDRYVSRDMQYFDLPMGAVRALLGLDK